MSNLELYIHIPFCEKKCKYCDFVSFRADFSVVDKYISKLLEEIKAKKYLANDYQISSIYIGGGTPSSLEISKLDRLLSILSIFKFCFS